MLEFVLHYFIACVSLTAIVIYLGKLTINKIFDIGFERYKAGLEKEKVNFKNALELQTLEHQVRFSSLHTERAEKIKVLYEQVILLEQALQRSTTIFQGPDYVNDDKRESEAAAVLRDFKSSIEKHKIYFSEKTVKRCEVIGDAAWKIIIKMRKVRLDAKQYEYYVRHKLTVPEKLTKEDLWEEAENDTKELFKNLKNELADEFRILLGIPAEGS